MYNYRQFMREVMSRPSYEIPSLQKRITTYRLPAKRVNRNVNHQTIEPKAAFSPLKAEFSPMRFTKLRSSTHRYESATRQRHSPKQRTLSTDRQLRLSFDQTHDIIMKK